MKKLDNKNKTYLNYSTEDGKNAQDILRDKITLKQKSVCGHCETENNEGLYCKSCGKSLDEVETSKKGKILKKAKKITKRTRFVINLFPFFSSFEEFGQLLLKQQPYNFLYRLHHHINHVNTFLK